MIGPGKAVQISICYSLGFEKSIEFLSDGSGSFWIDNL